MELLALNSGFIIDSFESVIWTDRYCGFGDFEIYGPVASNLLGALQSDVLIISKESEHVMVVEDRQLTTDEEKGDLVLITGRSLESLLDRRIIWDQTVLTGNFQDGIEQLLNENVIDPLNPERQIPNFIFKESTDPRITGLTIDAQFLGESLYDVIISLCNEHDLGFKITLSPENLFVFELFKGEDRSYSQVENPYVVFSYKFENLLSSEYIETNRHSKTITLVFGMDGEYTIVFYTEEEPTGLARRELTTDATDLSNIVDGVPLSDEEYEIQLAQRGIYNLLENKVHTSFDGQVDDTKLFKYGEDFFLGDIVQLENRYGLETRSRITETIISQNLSGTYRYQSFVPLTT